MYTVSHLHFETGLAVTNGTAPARSAVKREKIRYNATLIIESEFNGPPSTEVDAAWTNLLDSKSPLGRN